MHPVIIKIGPITIFSFGMMVAVAFLAGAWVTVRRARRYGVAPEAVLDGIVWALIAAIAGARLLYVGLHWQTFQSSPLDVVATWKGGMSFHGGLIAGVGTGWLFARIRKLPLASLLDCAAPGLALGYAIGRVGCLLNGCCQGMPTQLPWGMRFPLEAGGWTAPSHPAQIYASLAGLALFAILVALTPRIRLPGQLAVLFLLGYSTYRFGVEYLRRGVSANLFALGLTEAQWASLAGILLAVMLWLLLRRRAPAAAPATDAPPQLRRGSVR